jgi:hypothetical protein
MPFKSPSQVRACFAKQRAALASGYEPKWNCAKWLEEKKKSPRRRLATKKSPKKSPGRKIYTGPRGGKYVIYKGRKVYV